MVSVLVDGNNLLHAAWNVEPERPVGRSALCTTLGDWARRTGARIHVVFDGGSPNANLAAQIGDRDVLTTFSGPGISADELLLELIRKNSAPRRLVVVSSDRQIATAARRRRAQCAGSVRFWERVLRTLASPAGSRELEPPAKRAGADAAETEAWLREWGFDDEGAADSGR
ncbi:MAG: NYN domain-containing protein [Phycisphaerae bacterium]